MKTRLFVLVIACTFVFAATAISHHSFARSYIFDQSRTIEGTIVDFTIRNPHSFVTVEVQDAAGNTQRWGIEWAGVTALKDAGVNQATLKAGDRVAIKGNASRDPAERKLLMQRIERSGSELIWEGMVGRRAAPTAP